MSEKRNDRKKGAVPPFVAIYLAICGISDKCLVVAEMLVPSLHGVLPLGGSHVNQVSLTAILTVLAITIHVKIFRS